MTNNNERRMDRTALGSAFRAFAALAAALVMVWTSGPGVESVSAQQVPQKVSFQGRLTDLNRNALDGTFSITFQIFDSASNGNLLWSEVQPGVVVSNGGLQTLLGSVTPVPYAVANNPNAYLQITVGSDVLAPRQPLVAVLYAFNAQELGSLSPGSYVDTITVQNVGGTKTFLNNITAPTFTGSGALLTALNPQAISAGSLPANVIASSLAAGVPILDSELTPNVSLLNAAQTASGAKTYTGSQTLSASTLTVTGKDASGFSLALSSGITMPAGTVNAGLFVGSGAGLSAIPDSALPGNTALLTVPETFTAAQTISNSTLTVTGTSGGYSLDLSSGINMPAGTVNAANMAISGTVNLPAGSVTGSDVAGGTFGSVNGSALTSLTAANISSGGTFQAENASALNNLTAGNISSGGTFQQENASALNNLTAGNISSGGTFQQENGSALTMLNAGQLTSGTVGSGVLPSTVAYTGIADTFTSSQTVTGKDATGFSLSLSSGIFMPFGTVDAANMGISGTVSLPAGSITGSDIAGGTFGAVNGSALTSLTAGNISSSGTFLAENASALNNLTAANISSGGTFQQENAAALNNLTAGNISSGGTFQQENGSALTTLNAGQLTSGTVGSGVLPSTVAYTTIANTFASSQTVTGKDATGFSLSLSSGIFMPAGTVNAANIAISGTLSLPAGSITGSDISGGTFGTVNASALNNLTAGNISSGGTFQQENASALNNLTAGNISSGGTFQQENASALNNLTAGNISSGGTFQQENASALNSLTAGNISSGGTFQQENASALTALNAGQLTSGTVGSGVLPSTVAYTAISNTFVSSQTVSGKDASGYSLYLSSGLLASAGTINAAHFIGSGSGLTNIIASSVAVNTIGAEQLQSGSILFADFALNGCSSGQSIEYNGSVFLCVTSHHGSAAVSLGPTSPDTDNSNNTPELYIDKTGGSNGLIAMQFNNTTVFYVDDNGDVYSGSGASISTMTPSGVQAALFTGSGAGLTNLSAAALGAGGTFPAENGSALTSLNASQLTSGALGAIAGQVTVNLSSLTFTGQLPGQYVQFSGNAALLASSQTFTGSPTFASTAAFTAQNPTAPGVSISSGLVVLGGYVGIGTADPRAPLAVAEQGALGYSLFLSSGLYMASGTVVAANFIGNGAGLTGITAVAPAFAAYVNVDNNFGFEQTFGSSVTVTGKDGTGYSLALSSGLYMTAGTLTAAQVASDGGSIYSDGIGDLTAASFTGNGAGLTNLPVTQTFTSSVTFSDTDPNLAGVTISSGLVVAGGSVGIGTANPHGLLHVNGHIHATNAGPAPSINSCGSNTVSGSDVAGVITIISDPGGPCSINFGAPWPAPPICAVSDNTQSLLSISATASGLTLNTPEGFNGGTINYICIGN